MSGRTLISHSRKLKKFRYQLKIDFTRRPLWDRMVWIPIIKLRVSLCFLLLSMVGLTWLNFMSSLECTQLTTRTLLEILCFIMLSGVDSISPPTICYKEVPKPNFLTSLEKLPYSSQQRLAVLSLFQSYFHAKKPKLMFKINLEAPLFTTQQEMATPRPVYTS